MLGLEMLDVAIGIIFIYLLLSIVCTAINEFIEGFLKLRAVDLEQGIRELLNDPDATGKVRELWNHQLIYSLFRGSYDPSEIRNGGRTNIDSKKKRYSRGSDLPSYIPSRNFALALMDVLLPAVPPTQASGAAPSPLPAATPIADTSISGSSATLAPQNDNLPAPQNPPIKPNPLQPLRDAVNRMTGNDKLKTALLTILDAAGDDAVKAREGIENWYNSSMDRVSGWYKRRVQQIVFVMGFVVAIAMNADTFAIFKNLSNDRPLRSAIVAQAQNIKNPATDSSTPTKKIQANVDTLLAMGLPIGWNWRTGWNPDAVSNLNAIPAAASFGNWFLKILGWLITGLAISLGAPFWFDVLNRVMVVRSTVKPTEKSPDESSQDRQNKS
jgi:hypothetical protein